MMARKTILATAAALLLSGHAFAQDDAIQTLDQLLDAVRTQVGVPVVVGEDDDDVGRVGRGRQLLGMRSRCKKTPGERWKSTSRGVPLKRCSFSKLI